MTIETPTPTPALIVNDLAATREGFDSALWRFWQSAGATPVEGAESSLWLPSHGWIITRSDDPGSVKYVFQRVLPESTEAEPKGELFVLVQFYARPDGNTHVQLHRLGADSALDAPLTEMWVAMRAQLGIDDLVSVKAPRAVAVARGKVTRMA